MLIFETVRYKNFLSTGNVFTEIKLNEHPTTLIVGENGAGKSTFLDAITFALFGKPFRNINKPQLVNSVNGKDCVVEIEFSISNKTYKVVRGIKPNIFEIYCNGMLVNQESKSKDYQENFEKLVLKMNYHAFSQIVILGSTNFIPFMQLSAADRRTVIENLLDIQIFSSMNNVVKAKISAAKDSLSTLAVQISAAQEKMDLHKKHVDSMNKNGLDLVTKRKKELEDNKANLSVLEEEFKLMVSEREALLQHISDEAPTNNKLVTMSKYEAKIESNIQKIKDDIEYYNTKPECPTCKQEIHNKEELLTACTEKLATLESGLSDLRKEIDTLNKRIHEIALHGISLSSLREKMVANNTAASHIKKQIETLVSSIAYIEEVFASNMQEETQLNVFEDELNALIEQKKQILSDQQHYDIIAQLLKDGGIKAKIIKQYIPIINKLVNKYLNSMNFFVNFTLDEEFKESIKSRHRDDFSYENFSEGEKARLNLAILFAWRSVAKLKNSANTNLLIFDEVFDGSLDATGTDDLLSILSSLGADTNLFVISHKKDQMVDKFNDVIKFAKVKNFSQRMK